MRERARSGVHVAAPRWSDRRARCAVHEELYQGGCLGCETARSWCLSLDADEAVNAADIFNGGPLP